MTASQRVCQTTNIVLAVASPTRRARSSVTRFSMNAKIGVHALRTVPKGVISVQVDFVAAKILTLARNSLNVRTKSENFSFTIM